MSTNHNELITLGGEVPLDKQQLYGRLGLSHLLEEQVPDEDPRLRLGGDNSLRTMAGFMGYFESRNYEGSPAKGYVHLARDLEGKLIKIAAAHEKSDDGLVEPTIEPVKLRNRQDMPKDLFDHLTPQQQRLFASRMRGQDERFYDIERTPGSRAFKEAIFALLQAIDPVTITTENGLTEATSYKARYHIPHLDITGRDINLFVQEVRSTDEVGDYTKINLSTYRPSAVNR